MKRITITIIIIAFAISSGIAQNLDIRAYGGFNILQLSSDKGTSLIDGVLHKQSVTGRPGYQFGASVTFGERFYVQPGFQYATLSTTIVNENTSTGNELTDETTLKVMSIPLKIGFRLINPETENIFNIRVYGGFDGHHVLAVDHVTKSGNIDDISVDDYSNMILNADFGMGIDLFIFFADFGYQFGLTPVHSGADQAKSSAFYGNFGIRISL